MEVGKVKTNGTCFKKGASACPRSTIKGDRTPRRGGSNRVSAPGRRFEARGKRLLRPVSKKGG